MTHKKKLTEVALPLNAINVASAREGDGEKGIVSMEGVISIDTHGGGTAARMGRMDKPKRQTKTRGSAKVGRPSLYNDGVVSIICTRIANGESLRKICADHGMPSRVAVLEWLAKYEAFAAQYARAREAQADFYADEIISIADDGRNDTQVDEHGNVSTNWDVIGRSKLRVDARKWIASKLLPKKYGEKVTQEHTGPDGDAVEVRHGITVALDFDAINKRREQIAAETRRGVDATVRTIG